MATESYGLHTQFEYSVKPQSFKLMSETAKQLGGIEQALSSAERKISKSSLGSEIGRQATQSSQNIDKITESTRSLQDSTKQINKSLKPLKQQFRLIKASSRNVDFGSLANDRQYKKASKELRRYISEIDNLQTEVRGASVLEREFTETLKRQQSVLKTQIKLQKEQRQAAKAAERTGQFKALQENAQKVMTPLTSATKDAVDIFAQFDDQMATVGAISTATGEDLDSLRKKALQMGSSTRFTATQAAEAMEYLALAGFSVDETLQGVGSTLSLASAGGLDLGEAADIATDSLSAFQMNVGELDYLTNVFAKTATSANTDIQQLGVAMSYAAPNAALFGASVAETSALIGVMSNAGVKADKAGTAARGAFLRLAGPTSAARATLDEFGISLSDSQGEMRNVVEIMNELAAKLDISEDSLKLLANSSEEGEEGLATLADVAGSKQIAALKNIFGTTGISGAAAALSQVGELNRLALANLGSGVQTSVLEEYFTRQGLVISENQDVFEALLDVTGGYTQATQVLESALQDIGGTFGEQTGAAQAMAITMEDNLAGSFRSLGSAVEAVKIAYIDPLVPLFRYIIERITKLALFLANLPTPIRAVISVGILLTAGLAAVSVAAGAAGVAIFGFSQAAATANAATLALSRSAIPLTGFFETSMGAFQGTNPLEEFAKTLPRLLDDVGLAFRSSFTTIYEVLGVLATQAVTTARALLLVSRALILNPFTITILALWGLNTILEKVVPGFNLLGTVLSAIAAPVGFIVGLLTGLTRGLFEVGNTLTGGALAPILPLFKNLARAIEQAALSFKHFAEQGDRLGYAIGQSINQALIGAGQTIVQFWRLTLFGIQMKFIEFVQFAQKVGQWLVSALAENSPGPTYLIRHYWGLTFEFIGSLLRATVGAVKTLNAAFIGLGDVTPAEKFAAQQEVADRAATTFIAVVNAMKAAFQQVRKLQKVEKQIMTQTVENLDMFGFTLLTLASLPATLVTVLSESAAYAIPELEMFIGKGIPRAISRAMPGVVAIAVWQGWTKGFQEGFSRFLDSVPARLRSLNATIMGLLSGETKNTLSTFLGGLNLEELSAQFDEFTQTSLVGLINYLHEVGRTANEVGTRLISAISPIILWSPFDGFPPLIPILTTILPLEKAIFEELPNSPALRGILTFLNETALPALKASLLAIVSTIGYIFNLLIGFPLAAFLDVATAKLRASIRLFVSGIFAAIKALPTIAQTAKVVVAYVAAQLLTFVTVTTFQIANLLRRIPYIGEAVATAFTKFMEIAIKAAPKYFQWVLEKTPIKYLKALIPVYQKLFTELGRGIQYAFEKGFLPTLAILRYAWPGELFKAYFRTGGFLDIIKKTRFAQIFASINPFDFLFSPIGLVTSLKTAQEGAKNQFTKSGFTMALRLAQGLESGRGVFIDTLKFFGADLANTIMPANYIKMKQAQILQIYADPLARRMAARFGMKVAADQINGFVPTMIKGIMMISPIIQIMGRLYMTTMFWYSILKPLNKEFFDLASQIKVFGVSIEPLVRLLQVFRFVFINLVDAFFYFADRLPGYLRTLATIFDFLGTVTERVTYGVMGILIITINVIKATLVNALTVLAIIPLELLKDTLILLRGFFQLLKIKTQQYGDALVAVSHGHFLPLMKQLANDLIVSPIILAFKTLKLIVWNFGGQVVKAIGMVIKETALFFVHPVQQTTKLLNLLSRTFNNLFGGIIAQIATTIKLLQLDRLFNLLSVNIPAVIIGLRILLGVIGKLNPLVAAIGDGLGLIIFLVHEYQTGFQTLTNIVNLLTHPIEILDKIISGLQWFFNQFLSADLAQIFASIAGGFVRFLPHITGGLFIIGLILKKDVGGAFNLITGSVMKVINFFRTLTATILNAGDAMQRLGNSIPVQIFARKAAFAVRSQEGVGPFGNPLSYGGDESTQERGKFFRQQEIQKLEATQRYQKAIEKQTRQREKELLQQMKVKAGSQSERDRIEALGGKYVRDNGETYQRSAVIEQDKFGRYQLSSHGRDLARKDVMRGDGGKETRRKAAEEGGTRSLASTFASTGTELTDQTLQKLSYESGVRGMMESFQAAIENSHISTANIDTAYIGLLRTTDAMKASAAETPAHWSVIDKTLDKNPGLSGSITDGNKKNFVDQPIQEYKALIKTFLRTSKSDDFTAIKDELKTALGGDGKIPDAVTRMLSNLNAAVQGDDSIAAERISESILNALGQLKTSYLIEDTTPGQLSFEEENRKYLARQFQEEMISGDPIYSGVEAIQDGLNRVGDSISNTAEDVRQSSKKNLLQSLTEFTGIPQLIGGIVSNMDKVRRANVFSNVIERRDREGNAIDNMKKERRQRGFKLWASTEGLSDMNSVVNSKNLSEEEGMLLRQLVDNRSVKRGLTQDELEDVGSFLSAGDGATHDEVSKQMEVVRQFFNNYEGKTPEGKNPKAIFQKMLKGKALGANGGVSHKELEDLASMMRSLNGEQFKELREFATFEGDDVDTIKRNMEGLVNQLNAGGEAQSALWRAFMQTGELYVHGDKSGELSDLSKKMGVSIKQLKDFGNLSSLSLDPLTRVEFFIDDVGEQAKIFNSSLEFRIDRLRSNVKSLRPSFIPASVADKLVDPIFDGIQNFRQNITDKVSARYTNFRSNFRGQTDALRQRAANLNIVKSVREVKGQWRKQKGNKLEGIGENLATDKMDGGRALQAAMAKQLAGKFGKNNHQKTSKALLTILQGARDGKTVENILKEQGFTESEMSKIADAVKAATGNNASTMEAILKNTDFSNEAVEPLQVMLLRKFPTLLKGGFQDFMDLGGRAIGKGLKAIATPVLAPIAARWGTGIIDNWSNFVQRMGQVADKTISKPASWLESNFGQNPLSDAIFGFGKWINKIGHNTSEYLSEQAETIRNSVPGDSWVTRIQGLWQTVGDKIQDVADKVGATNLWDTLKGAWEKTKTWFAGFRNAVKDMREGNERRQLADRLRRGERPEGLSSYSPARQQQMADIQTQTGERWMTDNLVNPLKSKMSGIGDWFGQQADKIRQRGEQQQGGAGQHRRRYLPGQNPELTDPEMLPRVRGANLEQDTGMIEARISSYTLLQNTIKGLHDTAASATQGIGNYFKGAAERAQRAWERTKNHIHGKTWFGMVKSAAKAGLQILGFISEASPGPSRQTRQNWDRTEQSVSEDMGEMADSAKEAGKKIEGSMEDASHHSKGIMGRLSGAIGKVGTAGFAIGGAVAAAGMATQTIASSVANLGFLSDETSEQIETVFGTFGEITTVLGAFGAIAVPLFSALGASFAAIASVGGAAITAISGIGTSLAGTLGIASTGFLPILLGVAAVSAAVAGLYFAFKYNFLGIRTLAVGVGAALGRIFAVPIAFIQNAWQGFVGRFGGVIFKMLEPAIALAQKLINALNHNPTERIPEAWQGAVERITGMFGWLLAPAQAIASRLNKIFNPIRSLFGGKKETELPAVPETPPSSDQPEETQKGRGFLDAIADSIGGFFGGAKRRAVNTTQAVGGAIGSTKDYLTEFVAKLPTIFDNLQSTLLRIETILGVTSTAVVNLWTHLKTQHEQEILAQKQAIAAQQAAQEAAAVQASAPKSILDSGDRGIHLKLPYVSDYLDERKGEAAKDAMREEKLGQKGPNFLRQAINIFDKEAAFQSQMRQVMADKEFELYEQIREGANSESMTVRADYAGLMDGEGNLSESGQMYIEQALGKMAKSQEDIFSPENLQAVADKVGYQGEDLVQTAIAEQGAIKGAYGLASAPSNNATLNTVNATLLRIEAILKTVFGIKDEQPAAATEPTVADGAIAEKKGLFGNIFGAVRGKIGELNAQSDHQLAMAGQWATGEIVEAAKIKPPEGMGQSVPQSLTAEGSSTSVNMTRPIPQTLTAPFSVPAAEIAAGAFSPISRHFKISSDQVQGYWEQTVDFIRWGINSLVGEAPAQGYELQKAVSEGSPGPTAAIREHWSNTVGSIGGWLDGLSDKAKDTGGEIEQSLTPAIAAMPSKTIDPIEETTKQINVESAKERFRQFADDTYWAVLDRYDYLNQTGMSDVGLLFEPGMQDVKAGLNQLGGDFVDFAKRSGSALLRLDFAEVKNAFGDFWGNFKYGSMGIVGGLWNMTLSATAFGIATMGWGITAIPIGLGLLLLVAAIATNFLGMRHFAVGAFRVIIGMSRLVIASIRLILNTIDAAYTIIRGFFHGIATGDFTMMQAGLEQLGRGFKNFGKRAVIALKQIGRGVINLAQGALKALWQVLWPIRGFILKLARPIQTLIRNFPKAGNAGEFFAEVVIVAVRGLLQVIRTIPFYLKNIVKGLALLIEPSVVAIRTLIQRAVTAIVTYPWKQKIIEVTPRIVEAFKILGLSAARAYVKGVSQILQGIQTVSRYIFRFFYSFTSRLIHELPGAIRGPLTATIDDIGDFITNDLRALVRRLANKLGIDQFLDAAIAQARIYLQKFADWVISLNLIPRDINDFSQRFVRTVQIARTAWTKFTNYLVNAEWVIPLLRAIEKLSVKFIRFLRNLRVQWERVREYITPELLSGFFQGLRKGAQLYRKFIRNLESGWKKVASFIPGLPLFDEQFKQLHRLGYGFEKFVIRMKMVWRRVANFIRTTPLVDLAIAGVEKLTTVFYGAIKAIRKGWKPFVQFLNTSPVFDRIFDSLEMFGKRIPAIFEAVKKRVIGAIDTIRYVWQNFPFIALYAVERITTAWKNFVGGFMGILRPVVNVALNIAQKLINALNHNPTERIPEAWRNAVQRIKNFLGGLLPFARDIGRKIINRIAPLKGVISLIKGLGEGLKPLGQTIKNLGSTGLTLGKSLITFFKGLFSVAWSLLKVAKSIGNTLYDIGWIIGEKLLKGLSKLASKTKDLLLMEITFDRLQKAGNWFGRTLGKIISLLPGLLAIGLKVINLLAKGLEKLTNYLVREIDLLRVGTIPAFRKIGKAVAGTFQFIKGFAEGLFGALLPSLQKLTTLIKPLLRIVVRLGGAFFSLKLFILPLIGAIAKTTGLLLAWKGVAIIMSPLLSVLGTAAFKAGRLIHQATSGLISANDAGRRMGEGVGKVLGWLINQFRRVAAIVIDLADILTYPLSFFNVAYEKTLGRIVSLTGTRTNNIIDKFKAVGNAIGSTIGPPVKFIWGMLKGLFQTIMPAIGRLLPLIDKIARVAIRIAALKLVFLPLATSIVHGAAALKTFIVGLSKFIPMITGALAAAAKASPLIAAILGGVSALMAVVIKFFNKIKRGVDLALTALKEFPATLWYLSFGFSNAEEAGEKMGRLIGSAIGKVIDVIRVLVNMAATVADVLTSPLKIVDAAWDKTGGKIIGVMKRMNIFSRQTGQAAQANLSEASPGPTYWIRRNWAKTGTAVTAVLDSMRLATKTTGADMENNMSAAAQSVENAIPGTKAVTEGGDVDDRADQAKVLGEGMDDLGMKANSALMSLGGALSNFAPALATPLFMVNDFVDVFRSFKELIPAISAKIAVASTAQVTANGAVSASNAAVATTSASSAATQVAANTAVATTSASSAAVVGGANSFMATTYNLLGVAAKAAYSTIIAPLLPFLPIILAVVAAVGLLFFAFKHNFLGIGDLVRNTFNWIKEFGTKLFRGIVNVAKSIFRSVEDAIAPIIRIFQSAWNSIMDAIDPVLEAMGIRGGGRGLMSRAMQGLVGAILLPFRVIGFVLNVVITGIGWILQAAAWLVGFVIRLTVGLATVTGLTTAIAASIEHWRNVFGQVFAIGKAMVGIYVETFQKLGRLIFDTFRPLMDILNGKGDFMGNLGQLLVNLFSLPFKAIGILLQASGRLLVEVFWEAFKLIGRGIINLLVSPFRLVVDIIKGIWNTITGIFGGIQSFFAGMWEVMPSPIKWLVEKLQQGGQAVSNFFGFSKGEEPQKFARGGLITGQGTSTGDRTLIAASPGEFIVNHSATQKHRGLLEAINAGALPVPTPMPTSPTPVSVPTGYTNRAAGQENAPAEPRELPPIKVELNIGEINLNGASGKVAAAEFLENMEPMLEIAVRRALRSMTEKMS